MSNKKNELEKLLEKLKENLNESLLNESLDEAGEDAEKIVGAVNFFLKENGFDISEKGDSTGLYIFTINYEFPESLENFKTIWRARRDRHKKYEEKETGEGKRLERDEYSALPSLNEKIFSKNILYIGKKTSGKVIDRVNQHMSSPDVSRRTTALKLCGLEGLDNWFNIKPKMFILRDGIVSKEFESIYINVFEKMLHQVLMPILGSSR